MAGPFYNNIKGTTAGTPGTGAFTPNAASSGYLAWSTVPTGWVGLVRFDDGTSWELTYSYWNGTTLSRASTQLVSSSSGSAISLTSASTASLICDGARIAPNLVVPYRAQVPICAGTTCTAIGIPTATAAGTAAGFAISNADYISEQLRIRYTSATGAAAQAGLYNTIAMTTTSSTAGRGGWEFTSRFGCSAIPTGPRMFVGQTNTSFAGNAGEPSAFVAAYAVFALDSTDTNIQLLTNDGTTGGTKVDTGIPLVAGGWYETIIWNDPGTLTIQAILIRKDTGAVFYKSTATDVPVTGTTFMPQCITSLGSSTGTAIVMHAGGYALRAGGW